MTPEYVLTVFYRDDKEATSYTSRSLVNTKATAREECKWENCARVVVISDEGQIIFDQVGDFA